MVQFDAAPLPSRPTAVDLCADALRTAILDGRLPPGERLPPERSLAARFGVHRVTLRGALARLTAGGLLESRQGSGTVVRDYRSFGGPELVPGLAQLAVEARDFLPIARDLLFVRRRLAGAVLQRLAEPGADPARLGPIAAAVERFAEVAGESPGDVDAVADADLQVLHAILSATGSEVLALCFNPVARAVRELPRLREALYGDPQDNLRGWRLLLAWLDSPDGAVADLVDAELERRDRATLARLAPPDRP